MRLVPIGAILLVACAAGTSPALGQLFSSGGRDASPLKPLTSPAHLQPVAFSGDNEEVVTAEGMFGDIVFDDPAEQCLPKIAHRSGIWGELLYLRAREAEVTYGMPVDGSLGGPPFSTTPIGSLGVVDPDYSAGFRIGGSYAWSREASVVAEFSRFSSSSSDSLVPSAPIVVRNLVAHPATPPASFIYTSATAQLDIDFSLIDLGYRATWTSGENWAVNWLAGLRYGRLSQDFTASFVGLSSSNSVTTNIDFDGIGPRLGLDAQRHAGDSGFFLYGNGYTTLLAGEARARYLQNADVAPNVVDTRWQAGRVVTMLDLELGAGWQTTSGRMKVSAGYVFSSWLNVVPTNRWLDGVQSNLYRDFSDTLTFDGFTARAEFRF